MVHAQLSLEVLWLMFFKLRTDGVHQFNQAQFRPGSVSYVRRVSSCFYFVLQGFFSGFASSTKPTFKFQFDYATRTAGLLATGCKCHIYLDKNEDKDNSIHCWSWMDYLRFDCQQFQDWNTSSIVGNFFKMTGRRYKVFKLSATFLSLFSVAANHVTPVHRSLSARKVNIHYQKIMNAFQNFRLNFIKILLGLSEFKPF